MPGPGGMSLLDMMSDAPQQPAAAGVNPVAGGGNYGTFGLNQWSAGAQAQPYFGGVYGSAPSGPGGPGGGQGATMPPDLAQYYDPFGQPRIDDPRKVAAESGVSVRDLASGFLPRNLQGDTQSYAYPSDKGGFFSVEDLYGLTGTPAQGPTMGPQHPGGPGANQQVYRAGAQPVPQIATFNQQRPSTNNWRLLGYGPGYIMRNGFVINAGAPGDRGLPYGMSSSSATAEHGMGGLQHVSLGTGAPFGMPNLFAAGGPAQAYWPGSITGGINLGPPGYWYT